MNDNSTHSQPINPSTNNCTFLSNNKTVNLSFIVTNARSLAPKIDSLVDSFEELELSFAVISESWLRQDERMNED